MSATTTNPITAEQWFAMPDDDVDRELISGELRERPITKCNRIHARTVTRLAYLLESWLLTQCNPAGEVYTGEVGTILRRAPDTEVGIDVAYFSSESIARLNDSTTLMEGPPKLAVEVHSPSDKLEDIRDKVSTYLINGVDWVWIVDPYFQTVQVHSRNMAPATFNCEQRLDGGNVLPGLDIAVAEIFARPTML